ncbi:thiosulfohydrolase SoxB [Roseicyclus sp.]|uniref:thiosulfohydrolase SoxB n=1 Tax=Roseicyclus sp. TaxID=1914329 RepID=UPI003F9F3700
MISRRHFVQAAMATTALYGASGFGTWSRLAAQQVLSQDDLIGSSDFGNVTLIHITDIHAQTQPIYFREPEFNIGVGEAAGVVPHLTGDAFRAAYGIEKGSALDYALTYDDFVSLARGYGRMGGLDRIATVVKAIRAERPDALLLDGGDTWQGSLPALRTAGQDMVDLFNALGTDAMTSHWEFTLGSERVREIVEGGGLNPAFLGANIFDVEWDEPVFDDYRMFERGGTQVAVIGQAFPYMPIANPSWMFPEYSFGLRRERIAEVVEEVRAAGAEVVVLLSHNGFDVDRRFARDIPGIDVILTGHTHDALPEPLQVGNTFLIASGSHGKFVSRVDLDVRDGGLQGIAHRLIPIFSDVIAPDAEMAALVARTRAPFEAEMSEVIGTSGSLLFRRGNFNGTWDDVICNALISQRDAQIALSPGFRWGAAILPGQEITREDIYNVTAMTYPNAYRTEMSGEMLKTIFEDVAENIFNPDPYYQQGGDMVRIGGLGYRIDIHQQMGSRISDMTLLATGEAIEPDRNYVVAGWASVNEGTEGPPIWEVLENHIRAQGTVEIEPNNSVDVVGG